VLLGGGEKGEVCKEYIEGLEWVLKYYTKDCPDWRWRYRYDYPPLIKDLKDEMRNVKCERFVEGNIGVALNAKTQLAYVLPAENQYLIEGENKVLKYPKLYPSQYEFKWCFCRYFWEAHPILPEISMELLLEWDRENSKT